MNFIAPLFAYLSCSLAFGKMWFPFPLFHFSFSWRQYVNLLSVYSIDVDIKKVDECIGDPEADVENPVLKTEQEAQVFED